MNNLVVSSNKIISFPNKFQNKKSTKTKIKKVINIPGEIEDNQNRGLELFKANLELSDTKLLVDNENEIIKLKNEAFTLDGHNNINQLLASPSNSEDLIRAREDILDQINKLPGTLKDKLYESRKKILKLNGFREKFDHFEDLKEIIKDLETQRKTLEYNEDTSIFTTFIFGFDTTSSNEFEKIRQLIPGHLQLIRNIGGNFFSKIADELSLLFKKASNFSLKDLKEIYDNEDYDGFSKLKTNIEAFCNEYSHWDGVMVAAYWARNGYIKTVKYTDKNNEKASEIKDPRLLFTGDKSDYHNHITNDMPTQNNIELYAGGNGSGKSTWLKTRLMLQLFYQTFGKVAAKDAELMIRDQIIFVNRGGSGYGEDLSAFGNDIERKLMPYIPFMQKDSLIFLDEFGSTIPEEEAYYLIRALLDYLQKFDAKIYMASHNERYINYVSKNKDSGTSLYNFQTTPKKNGEIFFSYKLKKGKDTAHTLKVFKAAGMPNNILRKASKGMLGSLLQGKKIELQPYQNIVSYSKEEREILKTKNKGFEGFSRYNDMVKEYQDKEEGYYNVVRKYKPLGYDNRPNDYYSDEDLFMCAHHPSHLDQDAPKISFDFMRYGTISRMNDPIDKAIHLESKGIYKKNIYNSSNGTLSSLTTWGLTNDVKELQERQKFFKEIGDWSYEDANEIYKNINTFQWILSNFQDGGKIWGSSLDFDYNELSRFNKAYWEYFMENIEQYIVRKGVGKVCEWFTILIDMEYELNNIPEGFRNKHKEFLGKLQKTVTLNKRYQRAEKRSIKRWKDEYKTSAKLAKEICKKLDKTISDIWGSEVKKIIDEIQVLYKEIDNTCNPIDILEMNEEKRSNIVGFLNDSKIFKSSNDFGDCISNGFHGMTQVISALKGSGDLLEPLLDKLRCFDSVHAHQIANYLEDFIKLPKVEDFVEAVKAKRDNPKEYKSRDYNFRVDRDFGGSALFELLGLIDIANQIKKLGWNKVVYNNTGEINIKGMTHPGVEKTQGKQISNDLYLGPEKSFDILEGATMGGKTFNIQSMQWIIRLSHSIGYVPAKYASLPCFDGLVYIDRILEDEENKLSAGQNDAKIWSEIILKIRKIVKEKSKTGRYWFSIDEMISSVPARFQKGLVGALLEELTLLGQRGQISIHNPQLVSNLIRNNPTAYNIRHPEIEFDKEGKFHYNYKLKNGRSIDQDGHFTAYSLETAEKMGLPKEIIDRAKEYKKGTIS